MIERSYIVREVVVGRVGRRIRRVEVTRRFCSKVKVYFNIGILGRYRKILGSSFRFEKKHCMFRKVLKRGRSKEW